MRTRFHPLALAGLFMFSTGGQVWARYMNEHNSRLTVTDKALPWGKFAVVAGISLAALIITTVLYFKWKDEDED